MSKNILSSPKANRALVMLESMLTSGIISVPFMTILYENELGMSHEDIAITQAAFTVVAMLLNIPLGWVADRFSRKWANIVGDSLCMFGLLLYANAHSMLDCVICETIFGVGNAFSQGVDSSLLKHFADKEDASDGGRLFRDSFSKMTSLCQLTVFVFYLIGFCIGGLNVRGIIYISCLPFVLAVIASIFIRDDSAHLETHGDSLLRSMFTIGKECIKNPELNIRIAAYVVAREMTHGIVWCFTPMMQLVGISGGAIVLGWAANSFAAYIGSCLARKYASRMSERDRFTAPIATATIAAVVMSVKITPATIALYVLFGIAQGWTAATMMPSIKIHVEAAKQTTVESFAKVCSQFYYIGAVWTIGKAADSDLRYAALATIVLFVPAAALITRGLKKRSI